MPTLKVIIPAFNEEECIMPFYNAVEPHLKDKGFDYTYLFVDDGSKDGTLEEIKKLREIDKKVNYISFSRNFGKESAMYAGLKNSKDVDAVIIIDADLQHPPYLIDEMIEKYNEGYKIIYTKQNSRKKKESEEKRGLDYSILSSISTPMFQLNNQQKTLCLPINL